MSDVSVPMKVGEVREAIARVQPGPVKVVLAAKKVVAGISESGLWPRVTIRMGDKEEVVALTEWADPKKKEDKKLSKLEIAILRIAGIPSRSMKSMAKKPGVRWELQAANERIRRRISSAISKAKTTEKLGARLKSVQRKQRTSRATQILMERFRQVMKDVVKLEDMTGSQIGKIWDRVKMEKIVEEVHDR